MIETWFWEILETSEYSLQKLGEKLEQLSKEQLGEFQFQYQQAQDCVHPYIDEMISYVTEGCSEDHADDFSGWVVSQGRAFFDVVKNNPSDVQEYLTLYENGYKEWADVVTRDEYRGWQSPQFIANAVYKWRFDEDLSERLLEREEETENK
jgi:hypothetical protein